MNRTGRNGLDITSKKFGKLTAVRIIKRNPRVWLCQCECGNTKEVAYRHLGKGYVISCGCIRFPRGEKSHNWKGYKNISMAVFLSIKSGADFRNIPFKISIKYIHRLFELQKGLCALSGITLILESQIRKNRSKNTASLDRIDNSKGYIKGNVHWVHKDINKMKNVYSQEYFISLCSKVYFKSKKLYNEKHKQTSSSVSR